MSLILYKTFRPVLLILVVLLLGCMFTDLCPAEAKKPVTHEQTKAQVELFRDALDNFGASSPKQVINIWVKAVKTRNGALHYAAASGNLKEVNCRVGPARGKLLGNRQFQSLAG